MPKIIGGNDIVDFIYYNHLPKVYSEYDKKYTKHQDLYKYLQASLYSGSEYLLDKSRGIKELVDPLKCPEELLPLLYKCWGLEYFQDIDVYYNRVFLANIGEFIKRRGAIGGIQFIVRTLTGMESRVEYERKTKEHDGINGRYLHLTLLANSVNQANNASTNIYVVSRFLRQHIPFYFDDISSNIEITVTILKDFKQTIQNAMTEGYSYVLPKQSIHKLKYKEIKLARKNRASLGVSLTYDLRR